MSKKVLISPALVKVADLLEGFEASKSVAKTGTGSRREGKAFEGLLGDLWAAVADRAVELGAVATPLVGNGKKNYVVLAKGDRELVIPAHKTDMSGQKTHSASKWLAVVFKVDDMVKAFPSLASAISKYAPKAGRFAGANYPRMFAGLKTEFDDTVLKIEQGVLVEKVLLEYKTAKASKGDKIDGNAHERLSFQMMQYLEVATRYPKCSLVVISNGAFARYRNKYHLNFHVQAERLSVFSWFEMEHASEASEYLQFLERLLSWLQGK